MGDTERKGYLKRGIAGERGHMKTRYDSPDAIDGVLIYLLRLNGMSGRPSYILLGD